MAWIERRRYCTQAIAPIADAGLFQQTDHARLIKSRTALSNEIRGLLAEDSIAAFDARIAQAVREDDRIRRLLEVEGIGPITASALIAAVGNGTQFNSGRDMSAWLGLTPRQQYSSGGKNRLGGISKRGDKYMRMLLIHGARAVLNAAKK